MSGVVLCVQSCVFFFKQKTAYEMRISDWSSDVCSSDLGQERTQGTMHLVRRRAQIGAGLDAVEQAQYCTGPGRYRVDRGIERAQFIVRAIRNLVTEVAACDLLAAALGRAEAPGQ